MFEHKSDPLAHSRDFFYRLGWNLLIALFVILFSLALGVLGYHYYENLPWDDAFVNAAMILSGMGPVSPLTTSGGKIFAGLYALFSGVIFLLVIAFILAPIYHRFMHKFHLKDKS